MDKIKQKPLRIHVQLAAERYFAQLEGDMPSDVYSLFLAEFERPLIMATLRHTRGNQSKAADILGVNRGTLRTKMKQYNLI